MGRRSEPMQTDRMQIPTLIDKSSALFTKSLIAVGLGLGIMAATAQVATATPARSAEKLNAVISGADASAEAPGAGDEGVEEEIKLIENIPLIKIGDDVINLEFVKERTQEEALQQSRPYGFTPSGAPIFSINWNECSGSIRGNYEGANCTSSRGMNADFLAFLQRNLIGCVNQGLQRIGVRATSSLSLIHRGVMADSNHGRDSLHAVGRAIDIARITAFPSGSAPVTMDYLKAVRSANSRERKFYVGLRQCIGAKNAQRGCPRRRSGMPVGSIAWEDRNHRRHIHLSMPFCPNTRGYNLTNDEEQPRLPSIWDI